MNLLVLGPQGSGKGTQAQRLSADHGIPHVSTGEMFRAAIADGTELGRRVEPILAAGELVPDELTVALIRERLSKPASEPRKYRLRARLRRSVCVRVTVTVSDFVVSSSGMNSSS